MKLAVIKTGGKQYIVKEGDRLKVEKINAPEGDNFDFDKVLLIADKEVNIGTPFVEEQEKSLFFIITAKPVIRKKPAIASILRKLKF